MCDGLLWCHYHEALQMDLFLHGEWVYPWEHKHHTHVGPITSNAHAERRHFQLPPLWSGSARAACVTKSHSQRAFYPPRLRGSWHWQRMCTQRHTQTQSACLMQCAITGANGDILVPETALQCVLLAKRYFRQQSAVCSCLPCLQQQEERFYCSAQLLFEYCLIPIPFLLHLEELYMTAGTLTLKTHLNLSFSERKDEDQRDRGMRG